jgi:hypothetical protein
MNLTADEAWIGWIGISLLALVFIELTLLFFRPASGTTSPPKLQFSIQDLLIAIAWYGVLLVIFNPSAENERVRLLYVALLPTSGFLFSMHVFNLHPGIGKAAMPRAILIIIFLCAFTFGWQVSFVVWWLFQCVHGCITPRATGLSLRIVLMVILAIYGAAFFLSVNIGLAKPMYGFEAYQTCLFEVIEKVDPMPSNMAGQLWLANPMFWLSLSFSADRRWLMALGASGIALLIGLTVTMEPPYLLFTSAGYVLWVASMAAVAAYSGIQLIRNKS